MANKNNAAPAKPQAAPPAEKETGLVKAASVEVGEAIDYSQYAGMGSEQVRTTDLATPYLTILQKNSPQVDPDSPKYITGAQVGMILNTVTGEIFDGKTIGITVVPCNFTPKVVEWVPRDSGGGFVAAYDPEAAEVKEAVAENLRNDKNKLINRKGNTMVDTAYHFVGHIIDGVFHPAIVSMTSTQHKPSRQWNSMINGIMLPVPGKPGRKYNPPRFSHAYQLTTAVQKNGEFTSYNWKVALLGPITDPDVFQAALAFSKAVAVGSVQTSVPPSDDQDDDHKSADGRGEKPF